MPQETAWAHCNNCNRHTNHEIFASVRDEVGGPWGVGPEEIDDIFDPAMVKQLGGYDQIAKRVYCDIFEIVKCRGCDEVAFLFSEQPPWELKPELTIRHPPAIARRAPEWVSRQKPGSSGSVQDVVPEDIRALMKEVYAAVQTDSRRLVAMGVRTALDILFVDKIGDKGGFKAKMKNFHEAGYLSVRQFGSLDTILDAGHAAIHRGFQPTETDICTLLDITESLVADLYLHEPAAARLNKRVPKRPTKDDSIPEKSGEKRDGDNDTASEKA